MAGLTLTGFQIKRLEEVLATLNAEAQEIFGDLPEEGDVVDVGPNTTLGRLIGVISPSDADIWEGMQDVYDAFNPEAAVGVALDNLVALTGLTRIPASATRGSVILVGSTGTFITSNSKVSSDSTGKKFYLTSAVSLTPDTCSGISLALTSVIDNTDYTFSFLSSSDTVATQITINSGVGATTASIYAAFITKISNEFPQFTATQNGDYLSIQNVNPFQLLSFSASAGMSIVKVRKPAVIQASESGEIVQAANTVTTIATPVFGWDSVYNPTALTTGRAREEDEELRERFRNSKFDKATNILESLYAALFEVPGITDFIIYENDTDQVSPDGIPAHSFYPIVDGGDAESIARAIWENKPTGILSFGNTTITILDSQDFPRDVSFSTPTSSNIFIEIGLVQGNTFPQDGEQLIREALIDYIAALGIGDDIVYSRLYTPINSVPGHQVDSLFIGLTSDPTGTSNITIPFDGKAQLLSQNITFV